MKTPAQVLREAAALVEKGHCKGISAMNATGRVTGSKSPGAVAWCALGAISAVTDTVSEADKATGAMLQVLAGRSLTRWNDAPERTAAEVAEAMRKAAENLENQ